MKYDNTISPLGIQLFISKYKTPLKHKNHKKTWNRIENVQVKPGNPNKNFALQFRI